MNLRWSWDERTRDLFRWVDPEEWDATHHDPVRLLGLVAPERLEALAADRASCASSARSTPSSPRYLSQPRWFQRREAGQPAAARRLLLARVRHRRGAPAVLGRPRRAGRRPPEGRLRPRRAARRRRPVLPPRLLPPGAVSRRLAAGALPRPRPVRDGAAPVRRTSRSRSTSPASRARARCGGPTSGASPLYLLDADVEDNPPRPAHGHRPALRRRHRAPAAAGDPARRRRRAGAAGARPSTTQVFHTNEGHAGFLGLERIRQHRRRRADVPRGASRRPGPATSSPPTRRCPPASTASPGS